jgi:hypothetical protein
MQLCAINGTQKNETPLSNNSLDGSQNQSTNTQKEATNPIPSYLQQKPTLPPLHTTRIHEKETTEKEKLEWGEEYLHLRLIRKSIAHNNKVGKKGNEKKSKAR